MGTDSRKMGSSVHLLLLLSSASLPLVSGHHWCPSEGLCSYWLEVYNFSCKDSDYYVTKCCPGKSWCPAPTPPPPSDCKCGRKNDGGSHRIVGGWDADRNEYPWQVAIVPSWNPHGGPKCGGTLISKRAVLTAAHCEERIEDFKVAVGKHNVYFDHETKVYDPKAWINFPGYNIDRYNVDGDYAIITLTEPVKLSSQVSPACLPMTDESYAGQIATVSGWGNINPNRTGERPNVLQELEVKVITNEKCQNWWDSYNGRTQITRNILCAESMSNNPGSSSCGGDSGGPLVAPTNDSVYELIGVVSFGQWTCGTGPAGYARVTNQLEWIKDQINEEDMCSRD